MHLIGRESAKLIKKIVLENHARDFLFEAGTVRKKTFHQIHQSALRIAFFIRSCGLSKSDRIAVFIPNSLELAELYFGCLYAGVTVVPMNPLLMPDEIDYVIRNSSAKAVFTSTDLVGKLSACLNDLVEFKFCVELKISGVPKLSVSGWKHVTWDALTDCPQDFEPLEDLFDDDEIAIFYTSGTTANPKGVVHRVSGLVENALSFGKQLKLGVENRFYNILQMSYLGGYFNLLLLPYVNAASVVLSEPFGIKHALNFWENIIKCKVNTLWLVPSIITILLEMDRNIVGYEYAAKNILFSLCGTAPLPAQVRKDFISRYRIPLYENYALSETLFLTTNLDAFPVKDGSVGKALPDVDISIRNSNGKVLQLREDGEIFVKTPHLMLGYYDKKKKVADDLSDWFPTGDIGSLDEEGCLYISGRKKDIIIRGGVNISPCAVENVICRHPAVVECAVVGIPNHLMGEEVVAVVKLEKGHNSENVQTDLTRICLESLSKIKVPSKFVFTDQIYKNANGKVLKRKIREWLLSQV